METEKFDILLLASALIAVTVAFAIMAYIILK